MAKQKNRARRNKCAECHTPFVEVPREIGVCRDCLLQHFDKYLPKIRELHASARIPYGLPGEVPAQGNKSCRVCGNLCSPIEGQKGFCGLREIRWGKLLSHGGTGREGILDWYYDPLPTNCCADFVCPAGTHSPSGWERYSYSEGPELGHRNLAVFYRSCSLGCLYCQNWHFRLDAGQKGVSPQELSRAVDDTTACICFFGGDPSTQAPHAIRTSRMALKQAQGRILRICFETNGRWNPVLLDQAARLSMESGGCIKFDIKAWTREVHLALTGFDPDLARENFERLVPLYKARSEPPLLLASTLMVPGYVDEQEVSLIAGWLASLDPSIPYSLLVFHPQFFMEDLPVTSRRQATACLEAAKGAGLERVHVGNLHLLKD